MPSGGHIINAINPDEIQGAFDSMTEVELEELASTKLDSLPEHVGTTPRPGARTSAGA